MTIIKQEFLCAINGHVMKEPVKAPSGLVFEQATIGTCICCCWKYFCPAFHAFTAFLHLSIANVWLRLSSYVFNCLLNH